MWEIVGAHDVSAIFGCAAPSLSEAPAGERATSFGVETLG
jgi:hypothetical protein